MKDNNKNIDKLIQQNINIEETSLGFSANVMDLIFAKDLAKEKTLSSLIQKNTLESPSLGFTANILATIEEESKKIIYEPVISKRTWVSIGSMIALVFGYVLFGLDRGSNQGSSLIRNYFSEAISPFSFELPSVSISPLFALSVFALSSLLFLDYYLRNRRIS